MIPKITSQDMNKIFKEKKDQIDKIELMLQSMEEKQNKKLMVRNYIDEFISIQINTINAGVIADNSKIAFKNNVSGVYNQYGYMIHPRYKNTPIDIFNFRLNNGSTMFKDTVECKVNDVVNDTWKSLLMSDNVIDKPIVFEEMTTDTVNLEFSIPEDAKYGMSRFNVIEIDPYILGAYNVEAIECYTVNTDGLLSTTPTKTISGLDNIGRTRIILDDKIKFSKVKMTFKNNFKSEINNVTIYPFGIRHISFMEADFLSTSCAIVKAVVDDYFEYVYNDLTLYTCNGKIETTADYYGIEFYTEYTNNTLLGRVYPSSDASMHRIPKNTKELYIKVPLLIENEADDTKEYLCLNGIKLNFTTKELIQL